METMETIFSPRFDYVCHSPRTHSPRTHSPRTHSPKTHPPRTGSPRRRRGEKSNCVIFEHHENDLDNGIMYSPHNIGGGMEDINFFDNNHEKRLNHKHRGRGKENTSFSHNHCGKRVENGKWHDEHHEAPVCTRKNSESNEIPIAYRKCKKRKCDVCYPKVTDYHDLNKSIDPVLFVRWEVKRTPNNSLTLQRVKYKINGLGQVLRSVERPKKGKIKEGAEAIKAKVRVRLDTLKGQKIIARRDQDGLYYPAVVLRCSDPRHAVIKYEGGEEANVLTRNIIPVGGAVARPPLSVGDYVLVRVVYLDTKDECYIPAVIRAEPQNQSMAAKFYSVVMYNGQKATTLRKFLVKISKERFELASMYIAEQHNESREETQDSVYVSPRRTKEKVQKKRPDDKKKHIRSTSRSSDDEEQHSFRPKRRSRRSPSVSDDSRSRSRSASSRSRSRSNSPRSRSKSPKNRSRSKSPKTRSKSPRSRSRSNSPIPVLKPTKSSTARSDSDSNDSERSRSRENDKSQGHSSRKSRSRSGSSGSDDGHKSPGEVQSETSLSARSELRRLRAELVRHQEKQEKQKKKLKKMSRKLARQKRKMKDVSFREESPSAEPIAIPGAEDEGEAKHPRLIELRKSLQHLRPGEEVLARWSDDGWYYRGIVKHYHGDYSYNVEDSAEGMERIWRENIISENDDPSKVYEIGNRVVALHPDYSFSYAPGTIQEVSDSEVGVEFYDGQFCWLPWNEAYHSSPEKYDDDVQFIVRKETELVGAACVARLDKTGAFYPGTVTKRCGSGRDYMIQWADGSESKQTAIHIFSAFTRRPHLNIGNRVLACADPVHLKFLPGYLAGKIGDKLIVKFCDGETRKDIDPALCYWLGQIYYDTVVKYYKSHDPSFY